VSVSGAEKKRLDIVDRDGKRGCWGRRRRAQGSSLANCATADTSAAAATTGIRPVECQLQAETLDGCLWIAIPFSG